MNKECAMSILRRMSDKLKTIQRMQGWNEGDCDLWLAPEVYHLQDDIEALQKFLVNHEVSFKNIFNA